MNDAFVSLIVRKASFIARGARLSVEGVVPDTVSSIVVRLRVRGGSADLPERLIVKAAHTDFPGADGLLFNDWAAVELLTGLSEPPLCARFYGGDRELPLIVLEDLGRGEGSPYELVEGLPHRITWGCIRRVPPSVRADMDRAYREVLVGMPAAAPVFEQAVTDALARWHILHVIHRLPEALRADRPRGRATLRQQVIAWVDAFADRHDEHGTRPALGHTSRRLAARLRRLWPAETHSIPYFPAFTASTRRP